jgi:hypothetical protein
VTAALDVALSAIALGLSPIPIRSDGTKRPAIATWAPYQQTRADETAARAWFLSDRMNVALVCGAVSGGLEALDFDSHDAYEAFVELCERSGVGDILQRVRAGYYERSPRGAHLLYFCDEPRTTKLARRDEASIIETKGEGGYIICAGSRGYDLISGSLATITTLTADERTLLHDVARALSDEKPREHVDPELAPLPHDGHGERPGDEWARVTTWAEILQPHGWVRLWTRADITYWRRPGKPVGVSATTNYAGSDLLYVFSTSTAFEAGRGIGKFSAYAQLEHDGDYKRAASRLRDEGYGKPANVVDLSGFRMTPEPIAPALPETKSFPRHFFDVPGLLGELVRYTLASTAKPQPVLALGGALCAIGVLAGRRVQSPTGVRTNVYVAALAETGAGKEGPRSAIRRCFRAINLERWVTMDDLTSDSAIYGFLQDFPSALFAPDEFGHALAEYRDRKGASGIIPALTKLYGLANEISYGKTYARDRRTGTAGNDTRIVAPNLCVYGTTVPSRFWAALSSGEALDGFLNRFLILTAEDINPTYQKRTDADRAVPPKLLAMLQRWEPDLAYSASLASGEPPPPSTFDLESAADRALDDLEAKTRARILELHKASRPEHAALYVRTHEHGLRLALIRAAGQHSPHGGVITGADAEWGAELAWHCAEQALANVENLIGDSEHDTRVKEAAAWLASKGTVRARDFGRKFQKWPVKDREDVVKDLVGQERVVELQEAGKRGPTARVLQWGAA